MSRSLIALTLALGAAGCTTAIRIDDPSTRIVHLTPDGARVCHPTPEDRPSDVRSACGAPPLTLDYVAPGRGGFFRNQRAWVGWESRKDIKWQGEACWIYPTTVAEARPSVVNVDGALAFRGGQTPGAVAVCFAYSSTGERETPLQVDAIIPLRAVPQGVTGRRSAAEAPAWPYSDAPRLVIARPEAGSLRMCAPGVTDPRDGVVADCGVPLQTRPYHASKRHRAARMTALDAEDWQARSCVIYDNLMAPLVPRFAETTSGVKFAAGESGAGAMVCFAEIKRADEARVEVVDAVYSLRSPEAQIATAPR